MLKPNVPIVEFVQKYGFKKCKKPYDSCYYLCIARGCKMIFLSDIMLDVFDWDDNDKRIHSRANCKYSDKRTAIDFLYEFIKSNMVISEYEGKKQKN